MSAKRARTHCHSPNAPSAAERARLCAVNYILFFEPHSVDKSEFFYKLHVRIREAYTKVRFWKGVKIDLLGVGAEVTSLSEIWTVGDGFDKKSASGTEF